MPKKILILFAHPLYEKSNANSALVRNIPESEYITFHDLYEQYPDFDIDVDKEQELLLSHDIIVWHHPMYWYSCPPLLKQWIDLVLEHGWAYGKEGLKLKGKLILQAVTTGGMQENYTPQGRDQFTITELFEPFYRTARVCNMHYLPPFVVHGAHFITQTDFEKAGRLYNTTLNYLSKKDYSVEDMADYNYMNDYINNKTH